MNTEHFNDLIPEYVMGKLSHEQLEAFNEYVINHPEALESLQEWNGIKTGLEAIISEPSEKMDDKFASFLNAEIEKEEIKAIPWYKKLFAFEGPNRFAMPLAAMGIVLLVGFGVGNLWNGAFQNKKTERLADTKINESKNETNEVRTQLVMSLANENSANKRLQAATEATKLDNATDKVIAALFKMLNTDTNVNVRLAAVTSLSKYVENPKVREGLILSITQQESPLVQIALADLMVTLKEEKSINSFEQLLERPDINSSVKLKLEKTINQII